MTIKDVLIAAKKKVAQGWLQEIYTDGKCYCSVGAIRSACSWDLGAAFAAESYMRDVIESSVIEWNDTPGRTQAEVLAAFDKAIALCEQEAA